MIFKGTKFRIWRWEGAASEETLKELMLKLRSGSRLSYLKAQVLGGKSWPQSKKYYWRIVTKNA